MKTTAAALVLCLNIGIDPPPPKWSNMVKIDPCARWECWMNPFNGLSKQQVYVWHKKKP